MTKMNKVEFDTVAGTPEKIPADMREKWGGDWGHRVTRNGKIVGWAARCPANDDDFDIEVIEAKK